YTETHPEVQRLADEYAKVRTARLEDEKRLRHQTLTENPEMMAANSEISQLRGQLVRLRSKQDMLRGRGDGVAKNQGGLGTLTLDRDVLKDKYQSLQSKV